MIEIELELDGITVVFDYERREAEPEVGYMLAYWWWDVKAVYLASDVLSDEYNLLDMISSDDLARIDNEIETYLNNKN